MKVFRFYIYWLEKYRVNIIPGSMKIDWSMTVGFYAGLLFTAILWHRVNPEIPLGDIVIYLMGFYGGM